MDEIANNLSTAIAAVKVHLPLVLSIIGILWAINVINWVVFKGRLAVFGLLPRSLSGLFGIFVTPILHGNLNHLFFNSIPLFVLMSLVLLPGTATFYEVSFYIVLLSGALVWLFGRKALHIGASGVVMGYWAYLMVQSYYLGPGILIILLVLSLYYFAGLFAAFIPSKGSSWEGHVLGFIAGVATAVIVNPKVNAVVMGWLS